MPWRFEDRRLYELPLVIALGTNFDENVPLRSLNIPLIEEILEQRGMGCEAARHSRRCTLNVWKNVSSPWQLFLRHLVFRSSGITEYTQSNTVSALRFLLPHTSAKDRWVYLEVPDYMRYSCCLARRPPSRQDLQLNGPWKEGQTVTSLEILRACLPSNDFEAIRQECPESWRLEGAAPVPQLVEGLDDPGTPPPDDTSCHAQ